jgi:hypothetical protein
MSDHPAGQPEIICGPVEEHEREVRARLAASEESDERARMAEENQALRAILLDLRGSRGYRLMRKLGRWGSIERKMRRVGLT